MPTSEDDCLDALQEAAAELGTSPTKAEYQELGMTPSSGTIQRVVGGWNEAKERAGLETFTQGENGGFAVRSKPEWVEIPEGTEWEELTPQQRWYYRNRKNRIEQKEQRRKELRQWFYELKRDELACEQCSESRPPCLDCHHEGEKRDGVSNMVNDGYSKDRIREEIDRCLVVCANCHRREHYSSVDPAKLPERDEIAAVAKDAPKEAARAQRRRWLLAYKRDSEGCRNCEVTDPVCLDFHHVGEKERGVGQMVSNNRSLPEIRQEIAECALLCANCHRQRHFDSP